MMVNGNFFFLKGVACKKYTITLNYVSLFESHFDLILAITSPHTTFWKLYNIYIIYHMVFSCVYIFAQVSLLRFLSPVCVFFSPSPRASRSLILSSDVRSPSIVITFPCSFVLQVQGTEEKKRKERTRTLNQS